MTTEITGMKKLYVLSLRYWRPRQWRSPDGDGETSGTEVVRRTIVGPADAKTVDRVLVGCPEDLADDVRKSSFARSFVEERLPAQEDGWYTTSAPYGGLVWDACVVVADEVLP